MSLIRPILLTTALALAITGSPAAWAADEAVEIDITEWTVPWPDTRPRDPDVAPDGDIWFVGQAGHYVGHFDPDTGEFGRKELPDGTGPHNVIVSDDETLWIAGNLKGWIGQMDPETGQLIRHEMPIEAAGDPHTLVFDDQGGIWFTVQWGNYVGHMDKATGEVDLVEVPTPKARPYGIKLDSKGHPWIALLGTNALATVDPETMELREVRLPREDARPRRLTITADDTVWYVDYAQGYLGRYEPATGEFDEWRNPGEGDSGPYAMASDDEGRIWFFETRVQPNRLVGFDPETEKFFATVPVPSGGGTVRHMVYDPKGHALWFGTDTNNIGRARLP